MATPEHKQDPATEAPSVSPARLEAFSDGVFAIAVTLLILEVKVSGDESQSLARQLRRAWPSYAAYVVSFAMIGTMWINHHGMFKALKSVDHVLVVTNMAMLLVVSFVPFPTKLVGEHLRGGTFADRRTAVLLYDATFIAISIAFPLLWWAITRRFALTKPHVTPAVVRSGFRRNLLGGPLYVITFVVALKYPSISLALTGALACFYLMPHKA